MSRVTEVDYSNDGGRNPRDNAASGDVAGDDCTCTDDRLIAYRHTHVYDRSGADENAVADTNWSPIHLIISTS
jgi:hypothetical protein